MRIRSPIAAGSFYPADPRELQQMVQMFLQEVIEKQLPGLIKAIIVPHAGYVYSGLVAASAYKLMQNKSYSKIILLGPSHYATFDGLVTSPADIWETSLGKVKSLKKTDFPQNEIDILESSSIHQPEHCLEVQLPFLQTVLKDFKIFPLLMGDISPERVAKFLSLLLDEQSLLVVSSDLSHYLPYKEAKEIDQVTINAILQQNQVNFQEQGEACGKMPIMSLMHLALQQHWQPHLLKALNSGDITGDRTQVVGYASFAYTAKK